MKYQEIKGDLFEINPEKWVLAHCISADVTESKNMNKGIAKIFRKKYPQMAGKISPKLKKGKAIRYQNGNLIIYNLVPKEKVWQKAKGDYKKKYYLQLKDSLIDMKEKMIRNNEQNLVMPRIASGLDGGNWKEIRQIIQRVFNDTDIEIQIRYIEDSIEIGNATYSIEKAKSGRSKCRSCGEKIVNNSLRLKESIPTQNFTQNKYYCKQCAIKKLKGMREGVEELLGKLNE